MHKRTATCGPPHPRKLGQEWIGESILGGLKISQTECGDGPAIEAKRSVTLRGPEEHGLVGSHVAGTIVDPKRQNTANHGFHLRTGSFAALISSGRLMGKVWGASCRKSP